MLDTVQGEGRGIGIVDAPHRDDATSLRRGQAFLLRRWLVVSLTTTLVLVATAFVLRAMPPRYTAHAMILLDPRGEKTFGPDDTLHLISLEPSDLENAILAVNANALLARVVADTDLGAEPTFNGAEAHRSGWRSAAASLLGLSRPPPLSREAQALAALTRSLRVERVGKSSILAVSVTALHADLAARLANAVAQVFVRDQRDAHLEATRRAAVFFAERLKPLGEQLRQSEDTLERFRRTHDLIAKSTSAQGSGGPATINEQQLGELNSRLASARAETAQAWARYDQAETLRARGGLIESVPDVVRSPLVGQLREQQAEVARKEADLAARYNASYPLLINARAERREIEHSIAREMARILANLKGAYEIAKSQEDALRASVAVTTGAAGLDSDLGPRLRELERVKLVDQTMFEAYLAKAKAAEQQSTFEDRDARVIAPADVPYMPAFPQVSLVLGCMGLFGLGLGVTLGMALDRLDPGFRNSRHTEDALGIPVLAALPWLKRRERIVDGRLLDPPRYLATHPHSRYAEAVHAIRAGIRRSDGLPAKIVLVTSSIQGEGKSMIALSLAISAARAGQRVLLLDADLRSPALSRYFGVQDRLGLVDMLSGIVGTDETTVPLGAGLAIMPSGRRSAVAPDLFASGRMERYVAHLRGVYDLVVVDAAPAGAVVDAQVLSDLSDRIVFVVGWRDTARDMVAQNLRFLGHPRKVAGIVLNKIDEGWVPYRGAKVLPFGLYGRGAAA